MLTEESYNIPDDDRQEIEVAMHKASLSDYSSFRVLLARKYGTNPIGEIDTFEFAGQFMAMSVRAAKALGLPREKLPGPDSGEWGELAFEFQCKFETLQLVELLEAVKASNISEYDNRPEHYHQFSSAFMVDLVEAYQEYSKKLMGRAAALIDPREVKPADKAEHYERILKDSIIPKFRSFIEDGPEAMEGYTDLFVVFEILEELEVFEMSDKKKIEIWEELKSQMIAEIKDKAENLDEEMKRQARSIACKEAFHSFVLRGITPEKLESLIKEKL